jgi:hypothetical protein
MFEAGHCMALQAFDKESGEARQYVEMAEWPHHKLLMDKGFKQRHMRR